MIEQPRRGQISGHVIKYFLLGRNMRKVVASIRSQKRLFQRNSLNRTAR
jgi:hypothetical protein